jgi:translation initiation factor 1
VATGSKLDHHTGVKVVPLGPLWANGVLAPQSNARQGCAMAKKDRSSADPAAPTALASFADLLRQRGVALPAQQPRSAPTRSPAAPAQGEPDLSRSGRIVLRRERKGHGGKTVTVVEGLGLATVELEKVARLMRTALGCGARVDGARVIVQGDHAASLDAWLRSRGARRVVVGN